MPAIMAQTARSMMPSIPLDSSPLEISHTTPQSDSTIKTPQITLISIALLLDAIPSSLPVAVAVIA